MFGIFKKKPTSTQFPTVPSAEVDFTNLVNQLTPLSKSAQMTFMFRYIKTLSPNMCKTLLTYTHAQLRTFSKDAQLVSSES